MLPGLLHPETSPLLDDLEIIAFAKKSAPLSFYDESMLLKLVQCA
jgi:hypothetical protein